MIRICVAGATGWVGRTLIPAIAAAPDLRLAGAVARGRRGDPVREALGLTEGSSNLGDVRISGTVAEALATETDVLVDYTSPDAVRQNVMEAVGRGVHCVVGTSGLTDAEYQEIDAAARRAGVGVLAGGNFAITAVLLEHFAVTAARYLPSWEIIDYAEAGKRDAPSGTVRQLAHQMAQVREAHLEVPIDQTQGSPEARGLSLNGIQVHSIRVPGYVISAEVIFGQTNERLSLRHDAGNGAEPYVAGTLLAVRHVGRTVGLRRGLGALLGLERPAS